MGFFRTVTCKEAIVRGQLDALQRLKSKDFAGTLMGFVESILESPRAPGLMSLPSISGNSSTPPKSSEALRLYRPSAYRALRTSRFTTAQLAIDKDNLDEAL